MIISVNARKTFDKFQHLFLIKTVVIQVIEWNILNTITDFGMKNILYCEILEEARDLTKILTVIIC